MKTHVFAEKCFGGALFVFYYKFDLKIFPEIHSTKIVFQDT